LKKFAADLKLDTEKFNNCLDTGKYTDQVQKDTAFGQSLGISSTPAFAVDGQPLIGAQPFEVFMQLIEQGLSGN
jgi:protein-disulfide isomerase